MQLNGPEPKPVIGQWVRYLPISGGIGSAGGTWARTGPADRTRPGTSRRRDLSMGMAGFVKAGNSGSLSSAANGNVGQESRFLPAWSAEDTGVGACCRGMRTSRRPPQPHDLRGFGASPAARLQPRNPGPEALAHVEPRPGGRQLRRQAPQQVAELRSAEPQLRGQRGTRALQAPRAPRIAEHGPGEGLADRGDLAQRGVAL